MLLFLSLFLSGVAALGQAPIVNFDGADNALLLGSTQQAASIYVDPNEWPGVARAARDLAADFGRVSGLNATVSNATSGMTIIVGTLGRSDLVDGLVAQGAVNVSAIDGQWEAFQSQVVAEPMQGVAEALVIVGEYSAIEVSV